MTDIDQDARAQTGAAQMSAQTSVSAATSDSELRRDGAGRKTARDEGPDPALDSDAPHPTTPDLVSPDEEDAPRTLSNWQVLGFLAGLWMRLPGRFAAMCVFALIATVSDLLVPVLSGRLVDALANGPDGAVDGAWRAYALFLGATAGFFAFRMTAIRWFEVPMTVRNMEHLANHTFGRVQRFSADWHANAFPGAIVRRITRAMWAYDMANMTIILGIVPTMIVLFGLAFYMLVAWPLIGLYALAVLAIFVGLSIFLSANYIRPANQESNRKDAAVGGAVADAIGSNAVVKSFGAEAREDARFALKTGEWRAATQRTWGRFVNAWLVQIIAVLALMAGLVGMLVDRWARGDASPGDVAFAISACMLMAGYMRRFGEEVQNLQRSIDELEDAAIYARLPFEVDDKPGAPAFVPGDGEIAFDDVAFGYANQAGALYEGFSLTIRPAERVALVGPTGSGKSTFVKLVQRLYDVDAGAIRIDGQDVRDVTQATLRRAIALVPQDPALFHRSIGENIAYARPDASEAQIVDAAKRAHAHDFIAKLPKGYDTLVGERGVKLSGGERQRVAIAR
ncbi:MAG: ABC transporter ATP-binding protein, partial [Maricaulaceae bacterium]